MADDAGLAPPDHVYGGEGEIPGDARMRARIVAIHPSVQEIPDELFMDCNRLEAVRFHCDGALLRIGKRAFLGCASLRGFPCPSTVTEIGDRAFYGCSNLKDVALSGGLASIEDGTFAWCASLEEVRIPSSVARIGDGAFASCTNLTSIGLPMGLRWIGDGAFARCSSLGSICVPPSVEYVGSHAFADCGNLALVRLHEDLQRMGRSAFRVSPAVSFQFARLAELHEDLRTLGRSTFDGCPSRNFQFARLSERTEAIALDERAASDVEGSLNEASVALASESLNAWEECRECLRRAHGVLTDSLKEVTTTLELALWKKNIGEEEEREPRPTRQECRVNRGADMNVAIREVLKFSPPPWP